jgi:hypothetical protein
MAEVRTDYRIGLRDETRRGFQEIERSMNRLQSQVADFGKGFAGGIVGALSIAGITTAAKAIVDYGDKLRDLSFATGQSVEQLSFLDFAAKQSGSSVDAVSTGAQRLAKNLNDIAQGRGKQAAEALDALGLSARELSGLDLGTQFGRIGDALNKIENPAQRSALGVQLFGKQFKELAPLILEGEEGLNKLTNRFVELDGVVTKEQADKFDALNDSFGELQLSAQSLARGILEGLSPALTSFFTGLANGIPFAQEVFTKFIDDMIFSFIDLQITVEKTTNAIANFFRKRSGRGAMGGDDGTVDITDRIKELRAVQDEIRKEVDDRALRRLGSRQQLTAPVTPEIEFTGGEEKASKAREKAAREAAKAESQSRAAYNAGLRETLSLVEEEARAWEQLDQQRESARRSVETGQERALRELAEFERLFGANSDEFGRKAIEVYNELHPEIDKVTEATKAAAEASEQFAVTIAEGFGNAIVRREPWRCA